VLLSDGKQAVRGWGANAEMVRLTSVVGQEGSGLAIEPGMEWAAMPIPVVPGLWMWAFAYIGQSAAAIAAWARMAKIGLWGAGVLIAVLALVLGARR
jgi:hypothetical protein